MKKIVFALSCLFAAASVHATIIASDDFTSGTSGTAILGGVQTGSGTWTNASGVLNPVLVYGTGGAVVPSGQLNASAALQNNYSAYTNGLSISTVFSVRDNKSANPNMYVGFLETINKGVLQNVSAGDVVGVRFLTYGANEGVLVWNIWDNGAKLTTGFNGSSVSFGSNDLIRLNLSYDFQTGAVSAEAYNLTQDSVIQTASYTAAGLTGFNYAGAGVIQAASSVTNPLYIQSFQVVEAIPEPATVGIELLPGGANFALSWSTISGASYGVQTNSDLVSGTWGTAQTVIGNGGTLVVTNGLIGPQGFFRIISE